MWIIKHLAGKMTQVLNIKYFLTSKTLKAKASYKDWTRISSYGFSR